MHTPKTITNLPMVVVYFVTFSLIGPNMNGTSDRQGQIRDCFPTGGGGVTVKAVIKAEHQHHVPKLRGHGVSLGDVPHSEAEKCIFETQLRAIW